MLLRLGTMRFYLSSTSMGNSKGCKLKWLLITHKRDFTRNTRLQVQETFFHFDIIIIVSLISRKAV
jgi:hypothetical protein